jgi:uracil-DNA glycosylase
MNEHSWFREGKLSRVHDPHVAPLNALVKAWRQQGRDVPWVDPDLGGIHSRILFLLESPGPASSTAHGSAIISPDNNDQTARRFRRLSGEAGLDPRTYVSWNVVPWYVSATGNAANATSADGAEALPYLHQFAALLTELRVVVVMGGFAEHWWLRYLRHPESPVLPLICAPHPSRSARRSRPAFEDDITIAMSKARHTAEKTTDRNPHANPLHRHNTSPKGSQRRLPRQPRHAQRTWLPTSYPPRCSPRGW